MLFLKSIILGFSVSAPIGPIGLLCIQRVLMKGKLAGFLTGFGAVTANIIYASIAAFGFSVVSYFLLEKQEMLELVGGMFLIYLGIKTFLKKPGQKAASLEGESHLQMFMSTLLLMITNPVTILNFTAMFAGLGFSQNSASIGTPLTMIFGVFLGATLWWVILSITVSKFRNKILPHMVLVNRLSGALIILLAIASLVN